MNKFLAIFLFGLFICNTGLAESYYFKDCKIDENFSADYLISSDRSSIKRIFINVEQNLTKEKIDNIKLITKDNIISEIIPSGAGKDYYLQYYLDGKKRSVSIQKLKFESSLNLYLPNGPKQESYCHDVKADWAKTKDDVDDEQKKLEFEKEEKRKRLEDIEKKENKLKQQAKEKKKVVDRDKHRIVIDGEFFAAEKIGKRQKSEKELKKSFNKNSYEICLPKTNFDVLQQSIRVVELGEVLAFPKKGTIAGVRLGIEGIIKCKN